MSKGSFLCSLLLLQFCIAHQLSLISSFQLTGGGGQIRGNLLGQDPIRRPRLMSIHGHDEFDSRSANSIFDEELQGVDAGDESASHGDEGEGLLLQDVDDNGGGDSGGTKDSYGSGGDVQCPECGKFFKNDKSMFGHLRSHPNRGYKGATPPVKPVKKLELSPESAATPSPGSDELPAQHSGRDPRLTPLEILYAYAILTLKYRDNSQAAQQVPQVPQQPSFEKLDAIGQAEGGIRGSGNAEQLSFEKLDAIGQAEGGIRGSGNAEAEFPCNADAKPGNMWGCDEQGSSIVKIPKKRRNLPKEVREAHRKKVKLVFTPKEKRPYACKHCKAEFQTNQALGGHVAGHHREKKVPRLNVSSGMASESQNGMQQVKGGGDDGNGGSNNHLSLQRGLLSKQFSTALDVPWQSGLESSGWQIRQQLERRNNVLSPVTVEPAPATPTDDGDARRLLNIDLNVEAPEQE